MNLHRFLRWWGDELAALVPAALRRRRARLVLPAERALIRELSLPLAAEENLREVLSFEMDRFTPFTADDVVFDVAILGRDAEQGRLNVLLVAARREVIDDLVAHAHGPAVGIAVAGTPASIDLMPRPPRRFDRTTKMLAGLGVILLMLSAALPFHRQQQELDRLNEAIAALRVEAAEIDAIRADIEAALASERFLAAARAKRPSALATLEALSVLVPDDAWLNVLTLSPDGVEFSGLAGSAEEVLRALEASPLFTAALFRAPVDQDISSQRERFTLAAKWE
jgi:general secretion pathway protein L